MGDDSRLTPGDNALSFPFAIINLSYSLSPQSGDTPLLMSSNQEYLLVLQTDFNLVIYRLNGQGEYDEAVCASNTYQSRMPPALTGPTSIECLPRLRAPSCGSTTQL